MKYQTLVLQEYDLKKLIIFSAFVTTENDLYTSNSWENLQVFSCY